MRTFPHSFLAFVYTSFLSNRSDASPKHPEAQSYATFSLLLVLTFTLTITPRPSAGGYKWPEYEEKVELDQLCHLTPSGRALWLHEGRPRGKS